MWRFKPFMPKEHTGLDGRTIDIGNLKIHIQNAIAEGGFSCVYLACDAINGSKQYALKHIICNDNESLELVMKEVNVMKSLRGHPNIVTLHADTILDMGRTKEALLVMEYCNKSLVNVLDSRGAGYFEETKVLLMFRDICNAVFAMHCQSPPIAHRDLKAENLLLSSDGVWKLCDFGSTSTNHKRFEKPEEMGIEEDNIRKHTTPAYRPPEMWDMLLREVISEKVDIWALGCLLFRICYFKSAFDGESKLQILNGNYRIPELPKYRSPITDLIRDMLHASPDARPDITQVWFRVNGLLPDGMQKSLPDRPPEMHHIHTHEGVSKPLHKTSRAPRRSPPPPPSIAESDSASRASGGGGQLGAFWTSQHVKDSFTVEDTLTPKFDEEPSNQNSSKQERNRSEGLSLQKDESPQPRHAKKTVHGKSVNRLGDGHSKDFEINFFHDSKEHVTERPRASKSDNAPAFQNGASFNAFAAEFGVNRKLGSGKDELLEVEIEVLKKQLKETNVEKSEITLKYEKLSAICRSQRQEIQELKQALTSTTPSRNRDVSKPKSSPNPTKKVEGTIWELQPGLSEKGSPSPDSNSWQAFPEGSMSATPTKNNTPKSLGTKSGQQSKQASDKVTSSWDFGSDNFLAVPTSNPQVRNARGEQNYSQHFGEPKKVESKSVSQPAGWAGF